MTRLTRSPPLDRSRRAVYSQFPALATRFEDDAGRLERDGEGQTAAALAASSRALLQVVDDIEALERGDEASRFEQHLSAVSDALLLARPNFCGPPDGRRWVAEPESIEVWVPDDWETTTTEWALPGGLEPVEGILASPNPLRWLRDAPATIVPGIFVARSDALADSLELSRRFAGVLDRLRRLVDEDLDRSSSCRGGAVEEFSRGTVQHGFMRTWHNCDGRGIAIVEVVQARPLPGGDVSLVYLYASAYAPGDLQPVIDALATFHLATD